jgi:hypothetical protein
MVLGEPVMGVVVVNVIGIEQRDHVDVEQRWPRARHSSSSSSLTNATVISGAPGR